jgi:hypothetical protein
MILEMHPYRVIDHMNEGVDLRLTANDSRQRFRRGRPGRHLIAGKRADAETLLIMVKAMSARKRGRPVKKAAREEASK